MSPLEIVPLDRRTRFLAVTAAVVVVSWIVLLIDPPARAILTMLWLLAIALFHGEALDWVNAGPPPGGTTDASRKPDARDDDSDLDWPNT